jgi:hypothetical protein
MSVRKFRSLEEMNAAPDERVGGEAFELLSPALRALPTAVPSHVPPRSVPVSDPRGGPGGPRRGRPPQEATPGSLKGSISPGLRVRVVTPPEAVEIRGTTGTGRPSPTRDTVGRP